MNLSTGYPYSIIRHGLIADYPKLSESLNTEVVIIGGGISGAINAYYLINAGVDCILVDARTIGMGSTCASTSLLQYELDITLSKLSAHIGWSKASHIYAMCRDAIGTLENICDKIGFKDFQRQPSLYFAAHKRDCKLLEDEYASRKKGGFDVRLLKGSEIYDAFGLVVPLAILSAEGAVTDAYLLTHALLQDGVQRGLKVFDRTAVTNIDYHRNKVVLHTNNGHSVSARKLVNASGYEIHEFVEKKIVNLSSTYAIASEQLPEGEIPWKQEAMLWNTADPYLYMRMTKDNRILIGGRDEPFANPERRDKLIKRKTSQLKRDFQRLFPETAFIPEFSWAGTFGATKDSLPYIGPYRSIPYTYYALGFGGNGIIFSVMAAEIIRDLIMGKKNGNVSLFSFSR